jgi:hypothetical protein
MPLVVAIMGGFASAGVENRSEWNAAHSGGELPWLVVVVDELGELRAADAPRQSPERGRRDAVHALISRAGRIGRAAGVHLVVCTQRPDADTVTPQLRAQLPATVALHCVTDTNSRGLLDNSSTADLVPRPGRATWQWDRQVEVQLPMLEKAEARARLTWRYRPPVEDEAEAFEPRLGERRSGGTDDDEEDHSDAA